jgi:carboxymethylenebutenolidase
MSAVSPILHLTPPDARRAGLAVVGAEDDPRLGVLCAGFAEQGYEVMATSADGIEAAAMALASPVVVLAFGASATDALAAAARLSQITAISLFDPPLAALSVSLERPVIAHFALGADVSPSQLDDLRSLWPTLAVYPYAAEPGFLFGDSDAARLARLRTLQLFHRAGGKAEMGG